MTDIPCGEVLLEPTWRSFGRSLASGAGALTALVSMLSGVPLLTSCGRGALALFGILILTRIGAMALARTGSSAAPAESDDSLETDQTDTDHATQTS